MREKVEKWVNDGHDIADFPLMDKDPSKIQDPGKFVVKGTAHGA